MEEVEPLALPRAAQPLLREGVKETEPFLLSSSGRNIHILSAASSGEVAIISSS
jgi:hypothetical protein